MNRDPVSREELVALSALVFLLLITASWWALALWPTGSGSPKWLALTQAVCFGVRESGLPDAGGWTALIGSPLGMLAVLVVAARAPFGRLVRRMRHVRWLQVAAAFIIIFVMGGSHAAGVRITSALRASSDELLMTEFGSAVKTSRPAPALQLIDQAGRERPLSAFKGRTLLITFAYAHCETVCPVLVRNALEAQRTLAAAGERPVVLIVTLDPLRDTPARLPSMAREWKLGADAYILSGEVAAVTQVLDDWKVARSYNPKDGMVTHPALAYVVDRKQRIVYETIAGTPQLLVNLVKSVQ